MAWAKQEELHEGSIYEALHAGLIVGMIMTRRESLLTCRTDEHLLEVTKRNSDHYSFIPVVDDFGRFTGLFDAAPYFDTQPPVGLIGQHFSPLSEEALIGADASILDFIREADQRPCRLVVSGDRIEGLVSISDMQRLPVRAALFALLTGFEITMAEAIRKRLPEISNWIGCLSEARRDSLVTQIKVSKAEDTFVEELLFTQFSDKCDIIRKSFSFDRSKGDVSRSLKEVRKLRDMVAHANDYAHAPDAARNVSAVVRMIFSLRQDIIAAAA